MLSAIFVSAVALAGDITFLSNLVVLGPVFAVAGAGSAAGSLAIARRGEDGELLEADEGLGKVLIAEDEGRELLREGS